MKVYCLDQELKLKVYPSVKAFLEYSGGWVNKYFDYNYTSREIRERFDEPCLDDFIVDSDLEFAAYNIMHGIYLTMNRE